MLGKVYKIKSPNTDKVYIGSTFRTLQERFIEHTARCNKTTSKIIIDSREPYIELIEEIKVLDKAELRFYENQYLELYRDIAVNEKSSFGRKIPHSIRCKIYREKNLEVCKEKARVNANKYYHKHKEQIKEKSRRTIRETIECPCGGQYTIHHKSEHFKTLKHLKYIAQ